MVGHCGPTSDIGEYSAIAPIADKPEGSEGIVIFLFADYTGVGHHASESPPKASRPQLDRS